MRGRNFASAALTVAGGAVVGLAVMYHLLGWTVLVIESGGGCGGRYSPCPRGIGTAILLAFAFTVAGALLLQKAREATERLLRGHRFTAVVLAGAVLAVWPGWLGYQWLRGPHAELVWQAAADRPSSVRGVGNWGVGGAVVRGRTDGLTSYAVGDGAERWNLPAPARESVCRMSRGTADGTGLVGSGRHGKPCATVTAVDLETGRALWTERAGKGDPHRNYDAAAGLAVAGGLAVVAETGAGTEAVTALSLEDGSRAWSRKAGRGCSVSGVHASDSRVLVVSSCFDGHDYATDQDDERTADAAALDPRTGKQQWRAVLPVESTLENLSLLSADPAVLLVDEEDERGTAAVLALDDSGRTTATIPLAGRTESLSALPEWTTGFPARPVLRAVVHDGLFVTAVTAPGDDEPYGVAAHLLADGRRVWGTEFEEPVRSLAVRGDELALVTGHEYGDRSLLHILEGRTGIRRDEGVVLRGAKLEGGAEHLPAGKGMHVFVNSDGTGDHRPALALR
ncbi:MULTISPECIES: PQQ-binding-like beta-propeller repeat protein [Streptomyces]|uniref:outer membrane protein assembly factor BamB family protein n=1 Tax=Streptomyces TaxID=1883 RepID=UPI0022A9F9DE|nr:PQQ-binding-like beta-propeller repeat protein [Streptomyces sp. HB2AG]MCZ2526242.1 PQQ-binding-like beta-propeller repeat protein [Streptomyces sp. HB2AG]